MKLSVTARLSNDTDADGDPITFAGVSAISANGGTVVSNAGWIFYPPAPGFTNSDTFTYSISDGLGTPVTGTVTVTPTANPDTGGPLNIVFGPVIQNGSFVVRFADIPGRTYTVEWSDNLDGPWLKTTNLTAPTTDQGFGVGIFEFSEPIGDATQRFYRTVYPSY